MWGCGLKYRGTEPLLLFGEVTPYVGVWIEMILVALFVSRSIVTPYAGGWIEITLISAR